MFYRLTAEHFVRGEGLCFTAGDCALRPPLYPLLLAPFVAAGSLYPWAVVLQAVIGAALVWIAFRLGSLIDNPSAGLVAAVLTAFSPYAIVHDTALQESVLVNLLIALGVLWLVQARDVSRDGLALAGGTAIGLAILTTTRVALFLPWAIVWMMTGGEKLTPPSVLRWKTTSAPSRLLLLE